MPALSIINISSLVGTASPRQPLRGKNLRCIATIRNAFLQIEDDRIADFGPMTDYRGELSGKTIYDAQGRFLLPAWCDSHTHLIFPDSREDEFLHKINGLSYAEIAARGGGILNSAAKLQHLSEDQLFQDAWIRLEEMARLGTGAVEIKSGYGLTPETEIKMLRVARRLKEKSYLKIKVSFLGAHAYPRVYSDNHAGYIDEITEKMIPQIAAEQLADYTDVFCEKGFFSLEETEKICLSARRHGLKIKLHANQLSSSGAVQLGVKLGAVSVDHLEMMDKSAIESLASSNTIGTLLPTAAFFLNMNYPPARELISAGSAIALATDFNPGSSPGSNMNFVVAMACIAMKMLPEEAINAATINGAFAMDLDKIVGSIAVGKKANLILTKKIPSLAYLPYRFSNNQIQRVIINGNWIS